MAADTASKIVKAVSDKAAGVPNGTGNGKVPAPKNPVPETAQKNAEAAPPPDPNDGKDKYIVDGQERWLSPEQARAYVQKGLAFEPKMDQLGRLQHETAALLETLETDPAKVIYNERFGKPHEVLAKLLGSTKVSEELKETLGQWYYQNVIVPSKMSVEERAILERDQKIAEYEAAQQRQNEERLSAENNARVNQAMQVLRAQIAEAMSEAGVPLDSRIAPTLATRVAQVMQAGFYQNRMVTPKEAMGLVKREILEYQKSYYDVLDEDKLVEMLGKENAEKVRKYFLKAVKDSGADKKPNFKPAAKREERKVMTPDEFREYLNDLKKGS